MHYYIAALKKYAVFSGRAQRAEYWYFTLFNIIANIVLGIIDNLIGTISTTANVGVLSGIHALAVFIPSLAVAVRRLHDTNHSGWWYFINFIPIIGWIIMLVFLIKDSYQQENQYGPNPKENSKENLKTSTTTDNNSRPPSPPLN